jgi:hypothetical protein
VPVEVPLNVTEAPKAVPALLADNNVRLPGVDKGREEGLDEAPLSSSRHA